MPEGEDEVGQLDKETNKIVRFIRYIVPIFTRATQLATRKHKLPKKLSLIRESTVAAASMAKNWLYILFGTVKTAHY